MSGQKMGMAERKRKSERRLTRDRVCMRTVRVWRRRFRGTLSGAQRILSDSVC